MINVSEQKTKVLYFATIPYIGALYYNEVFFSFEDIPIIFSCIDRKQNLYLCHCNEIRGIQKWNIVPTTDSIIEDMCADKITVYEALKRSSSEVICAEYKKEWGIIKAYKRNFAYLDLLDLPDRDTYLYDTRDC